MDSLSRRALLEVRGKIFDLSKLVSFMRPIYSIWSIKNQ